MLTATSTPGGSPYLNAQTLTAYAALISALVGGGCAALIAQLSTRKRTEAETRLREAEAKRADAEAERADAEAERSKAETARLLREMNQPLSPQPPPGSTPRGWFLTGSNPEDYDIGTDTTVAHSGTRSGFIAAQPSPRGFGTLMQEFSAEHFQSTRQRLSAYIKTAGVERWAALWMRVDGPDGKVLAFDNMQDRPISGTRDWRSYHIVLDVPEDSEAIAFGVLLNGPGRVWLDDIQITLVGQDTPTTSKEHTLEPAPINLDFEQTDRP